MSAKFPRRGGGAGPFLARSLLGIKCSNSLDFDLFYLASYHILMKQKEYDE